MKAIFPSSLAQSESMRLALQRRHVELSEAQIEIGTGRHADVGLVLGARVSTVVDMRALAKELEAIQQTNGVVRERLETSQDVLSRLGEIAQDLFGAMLAARQSGGERSVLVEAARGGMEQLVQLTGVTSGGAYVFSGMNDDQPPLADYLSNTAGPARIAVTTAFSGLVAGAGGQASDITAADMATYLDTTFAALFEDPSWSATFSSASDEGKSDRIGVDDVMRTPVTANDAAIRDLYKVLSGLLDSDLEALDAEAFDVLADRLGSVVAGASGSIARAQAVLGVAQERLAKASDRIMYERSALEQGIGAAEDVDPYEVATRITSLMTALESSYAVTARLQNMTLLKYL